jgi:hypothetical protein
VVSVNNHAASVYELDRLLLDVVLARSRGVERHGLPEWLRSRRDEWYQAFPARGRAEALVRRVAAAVVPLEQALPRAVTAAWASPFTRCLDAVMVDYYNPVVGDRLRLPGHRTAGGRSGLPFRRLWDDPVRPAGLTDHLRANHEPGLPVWVAENGLCNRVAGGRAWPRADGWDRVRFLRASLAATTTAVDQGVPVEAYFHWTLADNYEWGSYEPRFGLYGVDRRDGRAEWNDLDSMGGDAAGTFRRLADGLRAGGRSVLG